MGIKLGELFLAGLVEEGKTMKRGVKKKRNKTEVQKEEL